MLDIVATRQDGMSSFSNKLFDEIEHRIEQTDD